MDTGNTGIENGGKNHDKRRNDEKEKERNH